MAVARARRIGASAKPRTRTRREREREREGRASSPRWQRRTGGGEMGWRPSLKSFGSGESSLLAWLWLSLEKCLRSKGLPPSANPT